MFEGEISVTSEVGKGSDFCFDWKIKEPVFKDDTDDEMLLPP